MSAGSCKYNSITDFIVINQKSVRSYMTLATADITAGENMISIPLRQRLFVYELIYNFPQLVNIVFSLFDKLVIFFELFGVFGLQHSNRHEIQIKRKFS